MEKYRSHGAECVLCGKTLAGYIVKEFKDQMDIAAKDSANQSIGVVCPNCESVFCISHSKEVGSKFLSGFKKVPCPKCKKLLNPHWNLMIIKDGEMDLPKEPAQRIQYYAEKSDYTGLLDQIESMDDLNDEENLKIMKSVFERCDDPDPIIAIAEGMNKNRSQINITRSLVALSYTKPSISVPLLADILGMNLQIRVGKSANSSTFKSIEPMIIYTMEQIGTNGIEYILAEVEKRESTMFTTFASNVFLRILNHDNWEPVVDWMAHTDSNYARFKFIRVLKHLNWEPEDNYQKALLLINYNQMKDLETMGIRAREAINKTLSCEETMGISFKRLKKVLEKIT